MAPCEMVDIILCVGECHGNFRSAARLYRERFRERANRPYYTIARLIKRARIGRFYFLEK